VAWRDVVQVLVDPQAPTAEEVVSAARRWQASAIVAQALSGAPDALGLGPDRAAALSAPLVSWAAAYRPTSRQRLLLAAHTRPGHVYWRQLAGLLVVRGARSRAAYLRALVVPERDYLDSRGWTWAAHARRAGRALTGSVRHRVVGWGRAWRGRRLRPRR
jgi:hypothetical protein